MLKTFALLLMLVLPTASMFAALIQTSVRCEMGGQTDVDSTDCALGIGGGGSTVLGYANAGALNVLGTVSLFANAGGWNFSESFSNPQLRTVEADASVLANISTAGPVRAGFAIVTLAQNTISDPGGAAGMRLLTRDGGVSGLSIPWSLNFLSPPPNVVPVLLGTTLSAFLHVSADLSSSSDFFVAGRQTAATIRFFESDLKSQVCATVLSGPEVPEPATTALLAFGAAALALRWRRRTRQAQPLS